MSLELSDAEIRRLRDLEALLTHVVITTLSDVDCQASMDRMLFRDVIGARNPEAEERPRGRSQQSRTRSRC